MGVIAIMSAGISWIKDFISLGLDVVGARFPFRLETGVNGDPATIYQPVEVRLFLEECKIQPKVPVVPFVASSGIIVGRFEAAQQPPQGTLEPHTCTKPPLQRGRTPDRPRLCAFPDCILAHRATSQTKPRTPCFSSLKAVFSEFYPLNSPNTRAEALGAIAKPVDRQEA